MTAVLVLIACGSRPAPVAPGGGFDVTATEKDRSATLRVGQSIELVLHAANGMTAWSAPVSNNTAVLKPIVDTRATAVRGVTLAAFEAIAPGVVQVTASAGPNCSPGQACPMFAVLFSLRVTVTQ